MKKYLFIACLMALTACQKGRTYFPKDIEAQQVEIVRFDKALLNVHEASVAQDIKVLYDEYPTFMPLWVEGSWVFRLPIQRIWSKPYRSF